MFKFFIKPPRFLPSVCFPPEKKMHDYTSYRQKQKASYHHSPPAPYKKNDRQRKKNTIFHYPKTERLTVKNNVFFSLYNMEKIYHVYILHVFTHYYLYLFYNESTEVNFRPLL